MQRAKKVRIQFTKEEMTLKEVS